MTTWTGLARRRAGARPLRTLGAALLALTAAVSLAACNPDQLGSAALVDGHSISTDTLQQDAQDYVAAVPNADQNDLQRTILERLILSRIIAKAAKEHGVHVRPSTVAAQRDQIFATTKDATGLVQALAQQQTPQVVAPGYVDQWIRDQLLYRQLVTKLAGGADPTSQEAANKASKELIRVGKTMDIHVSPRYGKWDPNRGVQALMSGGLSRTEAELAGS